MSLFTRTLPYGAVTIPTLIWETEKEGQRSVVDPSIKIENAEEAGHAEGAGDIEETGSLQCPTCFCDVGSVSDSIPLVDDVVRERDIVAHVVWTPDQSVIYHLYCRTCVPNQHGEAFNANGLPNGRCPTCRAEDFQWQYISREKRDGVKRLVHLKPGYSRLFKTTLIALNCLQWVIAAPFIALERMINLVALITYTAGVALGNLVDRAPILRPLLFAAALFVPDAVVLSVLGVICLSGYYQFLSSNQRLLNRLLPVNTPRRIWNGQII